MIRNILIGIGALLSALLGYVVFQISGLYAGCESMLLKYILGSALIVLYISAFKSGVVNNKAHQKYIM
jgi:hypothetical protein